MNSPVNMQEVVESMSRLHYFIFVGLISLGLVLTFTVTFFFFSLHLFKLFFLAIYKLLWFTTHRPSFPQKAFRS